MWTVQTSLWLSRSLLSDFSVGRNLPSAVGKMLQGCRVSDFCRTNVFQPSFHHRKFAPRTMIRRDIRVSSSIASSGIPDLSISVRPAVDASPQGMADRLRLGDLADDGFSYKERFIVRCYEVGVNKTATIETLANLLQEVACSHAQSVGFSTDGFATTNTMRKRNLIWVALRMHIEVYKYPAWADVVEIETWIQEEGRIGTRRDWVMKDFATGTVIGRATSKWVMMNVLTRRLERVTDDVRSELSVYCPQTIRLAFPEEDNCSLKKIPLLDDPAQHMRMGLMPRRADFDMNQHVNNVTYIGWVLESMPQQVLDTHELQTITLDYRRECQREDQVDSLTSFETDGTEADSGGVPMNGSASVMMGKNVVDPDKEGPQFLHLLRLSGQGLEINRGRTVWRRKTGQHS